MEKTIEFVDAADPTDFKAALQARENFITEVITAQHAMTDTPGAVLTVTLTFMFDELLYHGKRRGYERCRVHVVKDLFRKGSHLYYIPTASRSRGYEVSFDKLASITLTCQVLDYSAEWAAIARAMRRYQINVWYADAIDAHLRGDEPHIKGSQNYWTQFDKPRTISFSDVTKGRTVAQLWAQRTTSTYGTSFSQRMRGTRRDRSVHLTTHDDGSWKYHAASEYAGCGNGDYYLMYTLNMAVYCETD